MEIEEREVERDHKIKVEVEAEVETQRREKREYQIFWKDMIVNGKRKNDCMNLEWMFPWKCQIKSTNLWIFYRYRKNMYIWIKKV